MTSELVRFNGGSWTNVAPGKVHAPDGQTFATGGHRNFYLNKTIDNHLVNQTCLICGQLTLVDFGDTGSFCAGIRTSSGFTSRVDTFYSNREWTGGGNFPGGSRRTGIMLYQFVATPNASTISLQVRIDMNGSANIALWSEGDNQSNMYVFPVSYF